MTYTQRRLDKYCKKFGLCKQKGTCQCKEELKFIADLIAQAVTGERARIDKEITEQFKYVNEYNNYDMRGVGWQKIIHPDDLLSSLDIINYNKDI